METGNNEYTVPKMSSDPPKSEEDKKSFGMQVIVLKSTEPSPYQYQTVLRSQCQLVQNQFAACFPAFDPSKLRPIDLSLPVTRLASGISLPLKEFQKDAEPFYAPSGSRSRDIVPSYCHSQLRLARKQVLSRIGLPALSGDKKLLAAVKSADACRVEHLLLEEGVNVNAADSKKRTALHLATAAGHSAIMNMLLARRADPDRQDTLGNTPLHLAVCRGDSHVVMRLLTAGANVNIKDNRGQSPLNLVMSRLNYSRRDKSISTDRLVMECHLIINFLKAYSRSQSVDEICNMMQNVSTREQVDVIMDRMAGLDIAKAS